MILPSYHTRANMEIQLLFCNFVKKKAEKFYIFFEKFIKKTKFEKMHQKAGKTIF